MKAFVAAVLCMVVIAVAAAYSLEALHMDSETVYAGSNVRLGE